MSLRDGLASLRREFSSKIPRTEYSVADYHLKLVEKVTGKTPCLSDQESWYKIRAEFLKKWDYGMMWATTIHKGHMIKAGAVVTDMGHAIFGGGDYDENVTNPYKNPESVYALDPAKQFKACSQSAIILEFEDAYRRANVYNGEDMVNMAGIYITMFSGLIDLFGWESLLMAMGDEPERFNRVVASYGEWIGQYFDALKKSSVPVVMIHDDLCWTSGPVTSPEWYRKNIFPHIAKFVKMMKEAGKLVYFTSDGFIEDFYEDFVNFGIDSLVMEPCNDITMFLEKYGNRCGAVGGMDCRTLTYSPLEKIKSEMERIMSLGRRFPGFMLAVGNHLSTDVPVERALYYNELYEKLAYR